MEKYQDYRQELQNPKTKEKQVWFSDIQVKERTATKLIDDTRWLDAQYSQALELLK